MSDDWNEVMARAAELGLQQVPMNTLDGYDKALLVLDYYDNGLKLAKCVNLILTAMVKLEAGKKVEYLAAVREAQKGIKDFQDDIQKQATGVVKDALERTAANRGNGEN